MKSKINAIYDAMGKFEKISSCLIFFIMFLLFIFQIFTRYFFTPHIWVQEAILALFLWMLIFATCFADITDENVKFTSVYEKFSPKTQNICDLISALVSVIAISILFFPSLNYIIINLKYSASNLPTSKGLIFSPFLYLLVSFWLKYMRRLIISTNKLVKSNKNKEA